MRGENLEIVSVDNYFKELCYDGKQGNEAVTGRKLDRGLSGQRRM